MRLTGSEIFLKCLQSEGVHTVFGHPGGVILHTYHVLLDYPIHHILCRHEQTAIHAVEGFYKASGRTGTAIVTSGPGATNTITGLTDVDSTGAPFNAGAAGLLAANTKLGSFTGGEPRRRVRIYASEVG